VKFLPVNSLNIFHLKKFIDEMGSSEKTFRYYDKRNPETAIKNHLLTTILFDDNAVGYGHLDKEDDKIWLGICVKEGKQGKGYGKEIMKKLVESCSEDIYLSVDSDNEKAIKLYKLFSFEELKRSENILYMKRNASSL
tara:strand:+ start:113 stop:526 length:414 start_codon:yes stop_codon:yes gene_type:complete